MEDSGKLEGALCSLSSVPTSSPASGQRAAAAALKIEMLVIFLMLPAPRSSQEDGSFQISLPGTSMPSFSWPGAYPVPMRPDSAGDFQGSAASLHGATISLYHNTFFEDFMDSVIFC